MKKRIFYATIVSALLLTACSNTKNSAVQTTADAPAVLSDAQEQPAEAVNNQTEAESEAIGDQTEAESEAVVDQSGAATIDVEHNIFDVTLNIPPTYVQGVTQEDLDKMSKENGYQSMTLNEDGSVTYVMTKEQHKMMMDDMKVKIDEQMSLMIESENYPSFTKITANDQYTAFEVTTTSVKLDVAEAFSTMVFYMYGGMYNYYNGAPVDSITVTYINADSGEVILVDNSKDME